MPPLLPSFGGVGGGFRWRFFYGSSSSSGSCSGALIRSCCDVASANPSFTAVSIKAIRVDRELSQEQLLKLNLLLNTNLCGLPVEDITLGLIESIKRSAGIHTEIISDVIDAAAEIVHKEEN